MAIVERKKVVEHRVSKTVRNRFDERFVIRLWVESDKEFGGVPERATAAKQLDEALASFGRIEGVGVQDKLVMHLFDALKAASSIEVCDEKGNGVTVHRDWP